MSSTAPAARSRRLVPLLAGVVVALLLLLAVASLGSYRDLSAARERQELLQQRIEAARQRNEELVRRVQRLQSDPASVERLAREQYRMMRPADVVIVLPEEPPAPPAEPVSSPDPSGPE